MTACVGRAQEREAILIRATLTFNVKKKFDVIFK